MTSYIFGLIFIGIAIAAVVVRKTYYSTPFKELKRQAKNGDPVANVLYSAVTYGADLRALLWLIVGAASAAGIILLSNSSPFWLAFITVAALLWSVFSWLPSSRVTSLGARLTMLVTPAIVWVLRTTYPVLHRVTPKIERRMSTQSHTGVYERSDLVGLIEQQAAQEDSRLSIEELAIVQRALTFGDYLVHDSITHRSKVQTIKATETVGPILIDELHKFELPFAIVLDESNEATGILTIGQLGIHSGGIVRDHMLPQVYYIHESDSLREALHAFFVTNSPVLIVTNSHEEYVGVITIESIIRLLLGHLPGEEFEQYADRAQVAARHPRPGKASKNDANVPTSGETPS